MSTSRHGHVTVLGAGSWGTTIASLAAAHTPTLVWARDPAAANEIQQEHRLQGYLPDLPLHPRLQATADLELAVSQADVLVVGIPSHSVRSVLEAAAPSIRPWIPIVSLTKGLEPVSGLRMSQVIDEVLPGHPVGVLAGPNLAREVLGGYAAAAVIAMRDQQVAEALQPIFSSSVFRVYTNTDVLGCELGGCLKNVIALAAGMADGLGVGDNTRAMVITRGLAEMSRLAVALGADPRTLSGLTGLGDLMATCMSPLSRNRHVGVQLAQGLAIDEIIAGMNMVAEGVKTVGPVMALAHGHAVEVPICAEVNAVINEGRAATDAFRGLRRVAATSEIHGVA
ncbi:MAG: NAD(P)H-dependent glycerol-3-phosphate dehydrogenase [Humibacillus sp.]|nr:NAD(P)H-dependent glycerol-3-phosphate dehydrogenase [Humibacillus sp.]MDN5779083.1 NAD(P)H-dependent glycerol-3-phosphate dehydrogenase [Humibacillus sp.]